MKQPHYSLKSVFRGPLLVLLALSGVGMTSVFAGSEDIKVPRTYDLRADADQVRERGLPILLMVSQTYCSFCETLKSEIIRPMILSGDYEDRVVIRELMFDDAQDVRDFDGVEKDPGDIARRYDAWLTPTVVFLDADGNPLVKNIRGVNSLDFYAYYLDEAIAESRKRLSPSSLSD